MKLAEMEAALRKLRAADLTLGVSDAQRTAAEVLDALAAAGAIADDVVTSPDKQAALVDLVVGVMDVPQRCIYCGKTRTDLHTTTEHEDGPAHGACAAAVREKRQ